MFLFILNNTWENILKQIFSQHVQIFEKDSWPTLYYIHDSIGILNIYFNFRFSIWLNHTKQLNNYGFFNEWIPELLSSKTNKYQNKPNVQLFWMDNSLSTCSSNEWTFEVPCVQINLENDKAKIIFKEWTTTKVVNC